MRFIYPASVLNPKQVDEFFADEASSAPGARVALWNDDDARVLERGSSIDGETLVYRGWILSRAPTPGWSRQRRRRGRGCSSTPTGTDGRSSSTAGST